MDNSSFCSGSSRNFVKHGLLQTASGIREFLFGEINAIIRQDPRFTRGSDLFGAPIEVRYGPYGQDGYDAWDEFAHPGLFALSYLSKQVSAKFCSDDVSGAANRDRRCFERFALSEQMCLEANLRFRRYESGVELPPPDVESVLKTARNKISHWLGKHDLEEISRNMAWGPGSSTRVKKSEGKAYFKFSGIPECTYNNLHMGIAAINSNEQWSRRLSFLAAKSAVSASSNTRLRFDEIVCIDPDHESGLGFYRRPLIMPTLVLGGKIITVLKDSETNRTIEQQPDLNMYVQKGYGNTIRIKLKAIGLDLNTQERNQLAASLATALGISTIDMSMASDCVCYGLVKFMCPPAWFAGLEQCRTQQGVLPSGKIIYYQKFSSMGNGNTFELESMIFYAILQACLDHHGLQGTLCATFGDDLIIDRRAADLLIATLKWCGFKVNIEKSDIDGPFHESCGMHFFMGLDVSPFYVRRPVSNKNEAFLFHNNLYRWLEQTKLIVPDVYRDILKRKLKEIRGLVKGEFAHTFIPDGFGDGAFIGAYEDIIPRPRQSKLYQENGWEGLRLPVLEQKMVKTEVPSYAVDDDAWLLHLFMKGEKSIYDKDGATLGAVCRALFAPAVVDETPCREAKSEDEVTKKHILVTQWATDKDQRLEQLAEIAKQVAATNHLISDIAPLL